MTEETSQYLTQPEGDRPQFRGVSHHYAFFIALGACATLLLAAAPGLPLLAISIYSAALCGLLGVSALYHRVRWTPRKRVWVRRLDHAMIFTLIAGTYTPFSLIALDDPIGRLTLVLIWLAALIGTAAKLWWIHAPDWLAAAIYVAAGCLIAPALPALTQALGPLPVALFVLGGTIYLVGALVFSLQWPDPDPSVFGYHEIFHLCVIAAATMHFVVIAYWLVL